MQRMNRLCLIAVVAAIATTLAAGSAWADEIENDAGSFTGHVSVSLASGTAVLITAGGNVNCSTVTGEGTVDNENVPNNATTEVGSVESLDFTDGADPECDTNIFGVSSCSTQIAGLPLDVRIREAGATDELLLTNVEITLTCETFVGTIDCHYNSPEQSGTLVGFTREITAYHDNLQHEGSGSLICPAGGAFSASVQLKDEAGDEIMLTEN